MKRDAPYILGLTGSIGTGKSTTARMLRRLGIPVHEADQEVHRLLEEDQKTIEAVARLFPHVMDAGKINRLKLGETVFKRGDALGALEGILHPQVFHSHHLFIDQHRAQKTPLLVLDIPLLFELGYESLCHSVMVTRCERDIQRERVLARPGMSEEKFQYILAHQWTQKEKEEKANHLLDTSFGKLHTFRQLRHMLESLGGRFPCAKSS